MTTIARRNVIVEFTADTSQLNRGAAQAEQRITGLQSVFKNAAGTFAGLFAFDIAGRITSGIQEIAGSVVNLAIDAEQTQVAFETFLGSAEAATKIIAELNKFSETTPFEPANVVRAGQSLLAFGVQAEDVTDTLRQIGDVSSGTGTDFNELTEIFGKARINGRLMGEDLNQLANRNIPIFDELAKQLGLTGEKTGEQIRKLAADGEIGFGNLEKVFESLTSEGGRFFELTAKQSETLGGRISTLRGIIDAFLRDLGERLLPVLKQVTEGLISFFSSLDVEKIIRFGKVVSVAVTALVSYNTVIKISDVLTNAWKAAQELAARATSLMTLNTNKGTLAMRLYNLVIKSNPIGLLITALTTAAVAFNLFGDAAEDAKDEQDEFNQSVAEGNRLLGATEDIEKRIATVDRLNKSQLKSLLSDIESELKANDNKNAVLIKNETDTRNRIEQEREAIRNATDISETERLERLNALSLESDRVFDNAVKREEGITSVELEERENRLNGFRVLVKERIRLAKDITDGEKKEIDKQLEFERKLQQQRIDLARKAANEEIQAANDQIDKEKDLNDVRRERNEVLQDAIDKQQKIDDAANEAFEREREQNRIQDAIEEARAAVQDQKDENEEERVKKQQEAIKQISDATLAATNVVLDALQDAQDKRIQLIEEDIEKQEDRVERAFKLAEEGNTELLQLEEERLNELNEKREAAQRKEAILAAAQIALNQAVAISETIVAIAKAFASPGGLITGIATSIALGAQTAAAVIATRSAFNSIQGFADGTEFFEGEGGPRSDSNLAFISRGERIVPADKNGKYFSTLNEFQNGTPLADRLHSIAQGGPMVSTQRQTAGAAYDMGRLERSIDKMSKIISKGNTSITLDKNGFSVHLQKYQLKQSKKRKRIG